MVDEVLPDGPEALLATLVRLYTSEGATREVDILSSARARLSHMKNDPVYGEVYCLSIRVPSGLYQQMGGKPEVYENDILRRVRQLLPRNAREKIVRVSITSILTADRDWRAKARAWLARDRGPVKVPHRGRVVEASGQPAPVQSLDLEVGALIKDDDD